MRKMLSTISLCMLSFVSAYSQTNNDQDLNLGFENGFPANWKWLESPEYSISLDSVVVRSGKYSARIEYHEESEYGFTALSIELPENYDGKFITLSAYIKTEDVVDGHAALYMRIDPKIAFENMDGRGIKGTTDWTKHEITLPMKPGSTERIVLGGMLVGKGKIWLDDFQITIDGKDLSEAETYERVLLPAAKDKEFDNGSLIEFAYIEEQQINNLELLGKLWGFLKYHHPEIGKGNYNWDYELFRFLPEYLQVGNVEARNKLLLKWIEQYGDVVATNIPVPTREDASLKPDMSWLENTEISADLINKIRHIYSNRHQGEHYYVGMCSDVGNPEFKNENAYKDMPYPDAGFRLLSLYRFWNMVQYFFPNRHLTDKNWNDVLKEYIAMFIKAEDELKYELAALQLIGEVCDTHSNLWNGGNKINKLRGNMYAPFRVQFVENKLVVADYYNPELINTNELRVGDVITHINGRAVNSIVDSLRKYYPASNDAVRLRDIAGDILRSDKDTVTINYTHAEYTKHMTVNLHKRQELDIYDWYRVDEEEKCYKLLDADIGYVTLANIKNEDVPVIKETFKETKGIIIDIRNYPSAFMPFSLAPYFVSESTPFVKFSVGNVDNPGEFNLTPALNIPKDKYTYQGKLVVLINEISQSQAEYAAMAFKAGDNTTIIGSQTAGADGNVSTILLPGGLSTYISGIGVYYPDGKETQRIGIIPDIEIKPSIEGVKNGRDELIEKAIQIINQ
ncbi:peptidase S41 [Alistipes sp. OttesenSCG-928-B03]|nr:peptidase S41 [Alistipes sp. OttesenSCG-928-B03]